MFLLLPFCEGSDDQPASVAEVLEPVLQVRSDHLQPHRLVLQVVPEQGVDNQINTVHLN